MPITVNGIGTHYYGKKNKSSRIGFCPSCKTECELVSYDTRLWFVVIYIPVIPLGQKRIIDECSRCGVAFVASKKNYEISKREALSPAMQRYEREPTPENALELHDAMLGFRHFDEARDFREAVIERFRESDILFQGLAAQMDEIGRMDDAKTFYEQAYAIRPDIVEIRAGAADASIAEGRLDEARKLLEPLEHPGAAEKYPIYRLEILARAYQRAGRHDDTLDLCKHLISELPQLAQNPQFRKLVSVSEKNSVRHDGILPEYVSTSGGVGWMKKAAIGAVAVITVVAILFGLNEYWRSNQQVFVLNDTGGAAELTIDGREPIKLGELTNLQLAEGKHHLKISGPINNEYDINIKNDLFNRWTKKPVWVVSVDGGSAILQNTVHYAKNPRPTHSKLVIVDRIFHLPHVDYAFSSPPNTMRLSDDTKEKVVTHLERIRAPAADIFRAALQRNDLAAFGFARAHLQRDRTNADLITAYGLEVEKRGEADRARRFFKDGLAERPVSVVWHRAYQDLGRNAAREKEMAAEYDEMLNHDPDNAALLYLRGRIEVDTPKSREYFRRACAADEKFPWPVMALAYDAASRANWKEACELAEKAHRLGFDSIWLDYIRIPARLVNGEAEAMEKEYRQLYSAGSPGENSHWLIPLCETLAAQGKAEEMRQLLANWQNSLPAGQMKQMTIIYFMQYVNYIAYDLDALPNSIALNGNDKTLTLHSMLLGRNPDVASTAPGSSESLSKEPWNSLAISVAYSLADNASKADEWREKTCELLRDRDADSRRAAALLAGDEPPTQKQLDCIVIYPGYKALLMAALAYRFPEHRSELLAMADRLNVRRMPPFQLVRQAVEAGKVEKTSDN